MFTFCRRFLLIFLGILCQHITSGTLIAKSDITICDSAKNNPHNVVDNKPCQKKLIVAHTVRSGQSGTEAFMFTTNKIYDSVEKEVARLYYPFSISISTSKLRFVYPFHYVTTVNNKPYEEVRTKVSCDTGWYNPRATCGHARDHEGNKIWDSQGFCCSCSVYHIAPRWARGLLFGGRNKEYYRGGQGGLCGYKLITEENDRFSHCMRMDSLWYDVFSISEARLSFVIQIQAYEQMVKIVNNDTVTHWVDGGKIDLNYQKRSGIGRNGRLLAKFHGTFESTREVPNLVHKYLLIPKVTDDIKADSSHPQVMNGFHDYMLIPSDMISVRPSSDSCDMIGVSYSSFRKLGGGGVGRGPGCNQKINSCFGNQPKHLFEEDTVLRNMGRTPNYFLERYGKCVGVNRDGPSEDLGIVYEIDDSIRSSLITLEVSADDMILIYNRADGVILKTFANNFDALSKDGKMTVVVQNTGLVTADFYVVFSGCSAGVYRGDERLASINPKATHEFHYNIDVYMKKGRNHFCAVELYDSRRKLQDTANVTFKTYTPCVCLHNCVCKCNQMTVDDEQDASFSKADCQSPEDFVDDYNDDYDEKTSEGDGFLTKILNKIRGFFNPVRTALATLLLCGIVKATIGNHVLFVAKLGLGGVRAGEEVVRNVKGVKKWLTYDAAMNLVDTTTNTVVILNHSTRDYFINVFFFYLLPLLIIIKVIKLARAQRSFRETALLTGGGLVLADDVETDVETNEPETKQTPNARRIVPKKKPNTKTAPKLKPTAAKLKGGSTK